MLIGSIPLQTFAAPYTLNGHIYFVDDNGNDVTTGIADVPFIVEDFEGNDVSHLFHVASNGDIRFDATEENIYYFSLPAGCAYEFDKDKIDPDFWKEYQMNGNRFSFTTIEGTDWDSEMKGYKVYVKRHTGDIEFSKRQKDNQSVPVEGATYQVTYLGTNAVPTNSVLGTYKTDENGKITLKNVLIGNYEFKETVPAPNYFINNTLVSGTVSTGNSLTLIHEDEKQTSIKLVKTNGKTDSEQEFLQGVKFDLFDEADDSKIGSYTTDKNGEIHVTGLHYGTYYFIETQTIDGYELNTERIYVTTNGTTTEQTITVTNTHFPLITVKKVDGDTKAELSGASFALYKQGESTPVYTSNGESTFSLYLEPGIYELVETVTPNDYIPQDKPHVFTVVSATDDTVIVENYKYKTSVIINKYITGTNQYLSGVQFVLTDAKGDIVERWTSENAPKQINNLSNGTYTLREEKVPDGYIAGNDITITVSGNADKISYSVDGQTIDASADKTINVYNDPIIVRIYKKDAEDNANVQGALLRVRSADGSISKEFRTTDDYYEFVGTLPAGKYTVEEISAPNGYQIANSIEITVAKTKDPQEFTLEDTRTTGSITITKIDKDTGSVLKGATFEIIVDGEVVDTVTTGNDGKATVTGLPVAVYENGKAVAPITYTVKEVSAPAGYVISTGEQGVVFNVLDNSTDKTTNKNVVFENDYTKVEISKTDIATGEPIVGAHLAVYKASDVDEAGNPKAGTTPIEEWVTDGTAHRIDRLPTGDYVLIETSAPDGYIVSENVNFTVTSTGTILAVEMKDDFTKIAIVKKDAKTNEILAGAELAIYHKADVNADGTIKEDAVPVDVWTSTASKDGHILERLTVGDYVLVETKAPAGYIKAENKDFTVTATANLVTVEMLDERIELRVAKADIDNEGTDKEEFLANAQFALYRAEDVTNGIPNVGATPIEKWTSDTGYHIIDKIPVGDYVIIETDAPAGYVVSNPITVSVKESKDNVVVVYNDYTKVSFEKLEKGNPDIFVEGATLHLYHANDIDENGNVVENAKAVDVWVSNDNAYRIDRLPAGSYVLKEISAPDGYVVAENIEFTVYAVPELQTVTMEDDYTKVEISKKDITTGKEIVGASLFIYKAEDVNADGSVKDGAVAVEQWLSDGTPHYMTKMPAGNYVLIEVVAPDGYIKAENVPFTVNAVGEIQTVEMKDDYTKVSFIKIDTDTDKPVVGAKFDLIDEETKEVVHSWTSDENAYVINYLTVGKTYRIVETFTPEGYATMEDKLITVENTAEVQEVVLSNTPLKINIKKVDAETEKGINGAKLAVYKAEDINADGSVKDGAKPVYEITSAEQGNVIAYIPVGDYVLIETEVPNGYTKAENVPFTVYNTENVQDISMEDVPTLVEITKVDKESKEPLSDAEIAIYDENGEEVYKGITNKDGKISVKYLNVNENYTFKEITAPEGYALNTSTFSFRIEEDGTVVGDTVIENKFTEFEISKKDTDGNPVKDVEFTITDQKGFETKVMTDENGIVKFVGFVSGKYTVKETKVSAGYVLNKDFSASFENNGTWDNTADYAKAEVVNDYIKVEISKVDIETEEALEGANLQLINSDGVVVDEWVSGKEPHRINKLPAGNYNIVETKAPDGYLEISVMPIVVEETGEIQTYVVKDEFVTINIDKVVKGTEDHLAGAHLQLIDEEGNVVTEWDTDGTTHVITRINPGKYTLRETSAPAGYVIANDQEIVVEAKTETQYFKVENDFTKVQINKIDSETGEPVIGAHMQLIDKGGKVVYEWDTDKDGYYIEKIPAGTYTLSEKSAPAGYVKAEDMTIEIKSTGEIQTFTMEDTFTVVEFNKVDKETNDDVIGATLQLFDKNGNLVDEWISKEGTDIVFKRLPAGEYKLVETKAPAGYLVAEEMTIVVKDTDEVQVFTMEDDFTKVSISKVDAETSKTIAGAVLELVNENGEVVATWTSTEEAHIINRLPVGTYKLVEKTAPEGYILNTEEVTVEVSPLAEMQEFSMENTYDDYDITISKVDATTKEELEGAKLVLTDEKGNKIDEWISGKEKHIIKGLVPGKYTLTEITAPDGYFKAESMTFELLPGGKTETTDFVMENDYTKVQVNKYIKGTDTYLAGAKLHIEDKDGNIIESWTTTNEGYFIYGLATGTYYLVEDEAPEGYQLSNAVEFTVTETGEILVVNIENQPANPDTPPSPQTGDTSNIGFYLFTMITSLLCLAGTVFIKKRIK